MNEKRFALEYDSNCYKCISDNEQKKLYSSRENICDLLNQLNDENEQLKIANARWLDKSLQDRQIRYGNANHEELTKKYLQLKEENAKLREELSDCEKFRYSVFKRMEKTIEDNCVLNKDAKYPCKAYDECLKRQGTNKPLPCIVNWMMGRPFENMLREGNDD